MTFQKTGLPIQPQNTFTVTMCGKWALFLALSAILNPGDEVLYLEPVWVSYPPMIVLAGGTPVAVTLSADDNFALPLTSGNAEVVVGRLGDRHRRAHRTIIGEVRHPHRLQVSTSSPR